jgi:hypothetical protein
VERYLKKLDKNIRNPEIMEEYVKDGMTVWRRNKKRTKRKTVQ